MTDKFNLYLYENTLIFILTVIFINIKKKLMMAKKKYVVRSQKKIVLINHHWDTK